MRSCEPRGDPSVVAHTPRSGAFAILDPPDAPGCLGRLGSYRILDVLGEGGMGLVFKGEERPPDRMVAIKIMRPEIATPEFRERFSRESQLLASIEHERVVPVFRVDHFRGLPYLVMPLLQGETLQARMQAWRKRHRSPDKGPPGEAAAPHVGLPIGELLRIGREIAEGLAAAHTAGVMHRDVKPSNVFLRGNERRVVLLDFGLARPLSGNRKGERLTCAGAVMGTAGYMAPEQASGGAVDARADLFSLGCVLYEMATGEGAFTGPDTLAVLSALANHQPPRLAEVRVDAPAALSSLVERLLAKSPDGRPQSAAEVVAALKAIERNRADGSTVELPLGGGPMPGWRRRHWLAASFAAVALGVTAWLALGNRIGNEAQEAPAGGQPSSAVALASTSPLRVTSIEVQHYARLNAREAVPRGVLGKQSFTARLGDQATIEARLSRPAYAYLVAFRPDGIMDLCCPDDESQPPLLSDRLHYPPPEKADKRYGLSDGVGLWVFAVVASEAPLPPFREFSSLHKLAWPPQPNAGGGVWWYDGQQVDALTASAGRTSRGKNEQALGPPAEVVRAAALLKSDPTETVAAIGFNVRP